MSAPSPSAAIGEPLDRVDGRLKVTGHATYSAEYRLPGLTYGYLVLSSIAAGRITHIDTREAIAQPGVITVLTHLNAPRVDTKRISAVDRVLMVLQNDVVHYDRQPVAVVIADSFESAKNAAGRVRVGYAPSAPVTVFGTGETFTPQSIMGEPPDHTRGDADAALAQSAIRIDNRYSTPQEHHNPMEPHATIAVWENGGLTVYDANQGVMNARRKIATAFGLQPADVHVITRFVGGGFGCKGSQWPHTILAAMAAKVVGRPVRIELWRPQMFGSVGYRPPTVQRVALGADRSGKLAVQIHETVSQTSMIDEFVEPSGTITTVLYASPAMRVTHKLTRVNASTPTFMRAPGESSGSFALESAMDELADAVGIDPLELRLRNYAESDPSRGVPFSSKSLRECYAQGARTFGWHRRNPKAGATRDGRYLIGLGMASATYPTHRSAATVFARANPDGTFLVRSSGVDIGTGAYTAFTQIAAETLGVSPSRVLFQLGDSSYPAAPVAGGSQLTASVGSAVTVAAAALRAKIAALAAADPQSPLHGLDAAQIAFGGERLYSAGKPAQGEPLRTLLARGGMVEATGSTAPDENATTQYSMHAFGAQFAEVRVDPDLGEVRLVRQVGAFAAGRIVNAKTARSQYLGGMVFGAGMALLEQTRMDERTGRIMNANLGEYLVPVNPDIPDVEIVLVPEVDPHINEAGVKGIGEIGIVGAAAAIANAVYNATGKRIRDLPISPEKIIST